jgi:hypothetical protein
MWGEILTVNNIFNNFLISLGFHIRRFLVFILNLVGEKRLSEVVKDFRPMDYFEFEELVKKKHDLSDSFRKRW